MSKSKEREQMVNGNSVNRVKLEDAEVGKTRNGAKPKESML
jgi:hypothetical protein